MTKQENTLPLSQEVIDQIEVATKQLAHFIYQKATGNEHGFEVHIIRYPGLPKVTTEIVFDSQVMATGANESTKVSKFSTAELPKAEKVVEYGSSRSQELSVPEFTASQLTAIIADIKNGNDVFQNKYEVAMRITSELIEHAYEYGENAKKLYDLACKHSPKYSTLPTAELDRRFKTWQIEQITKHWYPTV